MCFGATEQDSVRLLTVDACGPLARLLPKDDAVRSILPIVQNFSQVLTPAVGVLTYSWSMDFAGAALCMQQA